MELPFRRSRIAASIAMASCAASCGRVGFDLLPSDSQQAVSRDGGAGGAGRDSGTPGDGGSAGIPSAGGTAGLGVGGTGNAGTGGGAGGSQSGGGTGTGGASNGGTSSGGAGGTSSGGAANGGVSSGGAPSTGGTGPDAGPPPVCGSTSGTLSVWSFNSTVEGWAFWPNLGTGTLSWTPATGNPAAGALSLDITAGDGLLGWIVMDAAAPDLSGHTGSVWLYLDSTTSAGVKMYVQSNVTQFNWADGGFVNLAPRTWTCVTINFSTPVYNDARYNPADVIRFGIEVGGTGPLRLYADQLAY